MAEIVLEQVAKTYNTGTSTAVKALKGIDLTIEKGEMIAIQGTSGAGKSTLLHLLGTIDRLSSGNYRLLGEDISKKKDRELAKLRNKHIGFVLQDFGLIHYRSVLDNIAVPLFFSDIKYKDIKKKCISALKKVDMHNFSNRKINQLSGGQKQRVAIARALVNDPEVILADEPTGSLDNKNSEKIMNILSHINKQGKTVIVVTHDDKIASYCPRKIVIEDGLIVADQRER